METEILQNKIQTYIVNDLLQSANSDLKPDTPLLEWGVLNSMNIAKLMVFVREEVGITIPPSAITGKHFKDLSSIVALVRSLQA
ncbi:MAG: acyl carrier protein [Telmatospirillum sp.]|nr:acyl carrier protein [Telmatospirillum sp.]